MRLQELRLIAFGPFTGLRIDLSAGQEGLHLVHGPNEAGKSTALRAISQLLYGIPHVAPDAYHHGNQRLRIGGVLANGEAPMLAIVRRKGNKNTLRDGEDNETIDEGALRNFLGHVDETTFTTMFGLDHLRLRSGGKEILEGGGELGAALFSAGAGLASLRRVRQQLKEDAEERFKAGGSKPVLNALFKELQEAKSRLGKSMVSTAEWQQLDETLRETHRRRAENNVRMHEAVAEENRLKRIEQAQPLFIRREVIHQALADLGDVALLRDDFTEKRTQWQSELRLAENNVHKFSERLEELRGSLAAIEVNENVLAQRERIRDLSNRRSVAAKAQQDKQENLQPELGRLQAMVQRLREELRDHLRDGASEIQKATRTQRERIRMLAEERIQLDTQLEAVSRQLRELRTKQRQAKKERKGLGGHEDVGPLTQLIRRIQKEGDLDGALMSLRIKVDSLREDREVAFSRCGGWNGSMDELEGLGVPSRDSVEHFRDTLAKLIKERDDIAEKIAETDQSIRNIQQEIERIRDDGVLPSESALEKTRNQRDALWQIIRGAWESSRGPDALTSRERRTVGTESSPADELEKLIRTADTLADDLAREAERVTQLRDRERQLAQYAANRGRLADALDNENLAIETAEQEWRILWESLGVTPQAPHGMRRWLENHQAFLDRCIELRAIERDWEELNARVARHMEALTAALALPAEEAVGIRGLDSLLDVAEAVYEAKVSRTAKRQKLEDSLGEIGQELEMALAHEKDFQEELEQWETAWETTTREMGLYSKVSPNVLNAVLDTTNEYQQVVQSVENLEARIAGIDEQQRLFEEEVEELTALVAPETASMSPKDAPAALEAALNAAVHNEGERIRLETECMGIEKNLVSEQDNVDRLLLKLKQLCEEAGVSSMDDLPRAEEHSRKRHDLERDLHNVDEQLHMLAAGGGDGSDPVDALALMAEEVNADELVAMIEDTKRELAELREEERRLSETIGSTEEALRRLNTAGEAAETASDIMAIQAAIAAKADEYARLALASAVLDEAVNRYRDRHQGQLVRRAGELFSVLTLGGFDTIKTDFDERDREVLIGIRSGSAMPVTVEGMSDGTADQLYLALRLASVESWLERHAPVPMVLDDILINFDDDRARAALRVLGTLSRRTQIIFFTHHRHLMELAREVLGDDDLVLHTLPGNDANGGSAG